MPDDFKSSLVPKQRVLTEQETPNTFTTWQESITFHIVMNDKFARYTDITDLGTWEPTSVTNRGYINDPAAGDHAVDEKIRMTAVQKLAVLKALLGSISAFAPVISNKYITEQASSLNDIFDRLRAHYGFRITGGRMLELSQFMLNPNESHETLWERMSGFIEDNLLKAGSGIQHLGNEIEADEVPTPTLHNVLVVLWLKTIHSDLPTMIKQRFTTQLKHNTLFSLRDEISEAIPSVLSEMQERECSVNFTRSYRQTRDSRKSNMRQSTQRFSTQKQKRCCLCESAGRPGANSHFLSECSHLPIEDKRYISKIRGVTAISESDDDGADGYSSTVSSCKIPISCKVDVLPSPVLEVKVGGNKADITLDSGAEINLIEESECRRLQIEISPTVQKATMADGSSNLHVIGEARFKSTVTDHHTLKFSGLVVKRLNCPILAGMPFLVFNDVFVRPREGSIYLSDCCTIKNKPKSATGTARTCNASIVRAHHQVCLYPGDEWTVSVPKEFKDESLAVEPRVLAPSSLAVPDWLKCFTTQASDQCEIKIKNMSREPVLLKKNEQFAQVRHMQATPSPSQPIPPQVKISKPQSNTPSSTIEVDPSLILSEKQRNAFNQVHLDYDDVFSSNLGCYNGRSGPFTHVITMGPSLPPQRSGKIPIYNRSNLELLQAKFDMLLSQGVFAKPEDISVNVEYVSPSFLIKKKDGGHRLVTAFHELGEHARPQPSVMPNVDNTLRHIAQWKFIIKSDLSQAYYQIPLSKDSLKYVGVVTPFRGTLVYKRAVMGLPGSEASLECLLSRILGDLIMEGSVVKLADDLYVGANTVEQLISSWRNVLKLLQHNGLKLSPTKTVCCPTSTVILGWIWEQGTIRSTPHRINTLLNCNPPETVTKLRSFVGSYKFLSKVLPYHADYLDPFENLCASNKPATEKINWTEELLTQFNNAKAHLKAAKTIKLPRREDTLQIITDASSTGLAAGLYSIRDGKAHLSGLFNAKRKPHQKGWLPCELEALAITASVKYFSPFLIQSTQKAKVLTDSKPCVDAFKKLSRGEFSASPRVTTFLSTLSHYQVELQHLAGRSNTLSDFASRNPISCDGSCQICQFIDEVEESVVNSVSVTDILSRGSPVPYASRGSWYRIQQDCEVLNKVMKFLKNGTIPTRKQKGVKDVKRYLNQVKLSTNPADGLLIVQDIRPLQPVKQRIVVPRNVIDGLLTSMHLKLSHPTKDQLKHVFNRAFYALDLEKAVGRVLDGCHPCASLKKLPSAFMEQSTSPPPACVGSKFSADVIRRERQKILLLREYVSSFTDATFILTEDSEALKEGLIKLTSRLRTASGPSATIRVDPATGFQAMKKDNLLTSLGISIEIGEPKNVNKNPVSEKAISEFLAEIARLQPEGGQISETTLSVAIANLNSRVRGSGYSGLEMWTKRDMNTGSPVQIDDKQLISDKQDERLKNHLPSSKYKARGKTFIKNATLNGGEIVYLYQDRKRAERAIDT